MSFLNKTIGFVAVLGTIPAAYALTARPSVISTAASRMPTMTATIYGTTSTTTTSTTSSLLANTECIDAYTSCMNGADACGPNFEECTTKVLFHAQMPKCLSTLAQCNTSGITSLFGVGNTTSLQTVATKNSYGEVTDYTYPTDGSVMGQMIIGAAIANKYDTSTCVKNYTRCLKKDSVCGADFELCTTDKEFRKQRVFCDSTLARCQSDGVIELFGSNSLTVAPSATSRVGELIAEGASLAAVNAVSTCYKVVDQCILNACATNPYRCNEDMSKSVAALVDNINNGTTTADNGATIADVVTKSEVAGYIKSSCLDTIGSNKYCYATFLGNGLMPTASQLKDEDNQEEIYDEAYASRMNSAMKAKIADLVDKFDTKAKQSCTDTIRACAMRTCGSGSGAACYYQVFNGRDKSINGSATYDEIKLGCEAVVNTDMYCKYAAANPNASGPYSYSYINTSAFDTLFPEYDATTKSDPIGVVGSLNATLANSYNDAALAQMKKQCQTVATSCVKSLCGADYVNCYRNRTDIYSTLTNTGNADFDKSMNKVGGVLDYTIVLGLCLDTVKNSDVCAEHLAIETSKIKIDNTRSSVWGGSTSVRDGWIDAGAATQITVMDDGIQATDANGNKLCSNDAGEQGVCYEMTDSGDIYDEPVMISQATYKQNAAASTLFRDLVYDIEKEAQAKYNAKLTKEQNACLAANQGGVLGKRDTGSAYMWVKLKSNKVPKNYSVNGLKETQFAASNDLYGSFCRARVTLQSDDKRIQDKIRDGASWSTAYFAVGDVFTCGSWIPSSALEDMANAVADDAIADKEKSYKRTRNWLTALGAVGGATGGAFLGSSIANGKALTSLTGLQDSKGKKQQSNQENCKKKKADAVQKLNGMLSTKGDKNSVASGSSVTSIIALNKVLSDLYITEIGTSDIAGLAYDHDCDKSDKNCSLNPDAKTIVKKTLTEVEAVQCETTEENTDKDSKNWKTPVASGIGAVVGGVGGGILLNKMTGDIQQGMLDSAHKEAYDEFMDQVGRHIFCYIGGEEAGEYGDVVQPYVE
ncbi:MAG: hypothetical protein NC311_04355 [Muribaculaceae bacterium]|nr:hypothetical protein [Muribaculaceae bacterium]